MSAVSSMESFIKMNIKKDHTLLGHNDKGTIQATIKAHGWTTT